VTTTRVPPSKLTHTAEGSKRGGACLSAPSPVLWEPVLRLHKE